MPAVRGRQEREEAAAAHVRPATGAVGPHTGATLPAGGGERLVSDADPALPRPGALALHLRRLGVHV